MDNTRKVPAVQHFTIGEESDGQRIDNFLVRVLKGVPKSHIYRILRSGEVRVGGRRIKPDYRLCEKDEVRVPPLRLADKPAAPAVPVGEPLAVAHEDEGVLVVDKPAGLAVHGGSGVSFGVIEQLRRQRPQAKLLELAHRLDRETSGLLVVAKKRSSLTRLHDLFREGRVEKRYLALVRGRWMNPLQHIKVALEKYLTEEGERRVAANPEGKPAHSIVRLVRRWEHFSLVEVELKTGRTHQIRVHLSHLGYPLAGDDKYGDFPLNKQLHKQGLKRMFLHAASISFDHPQSGERIALSSALPPELQGFIDQIDRTERCDYPS